MGQHNSHAVLQENTIISKTKQLNISEEDLQRLQQRVCEEYPFVATVYESVVVTDITLPDNPIVFCNDNFQRMTLYSREEIIGKNCRFLQGKYTSKAATAKIRNAIETGREVDVQLLNYRKDGTPFWNNFLLLPVHRKKGSKKVTHFIAIQKDVTILKQGQKDPARWGPKELALFVTYLEPLQGHTPAVGERSIVDLIIDRKITGARFLASSRQDWQRWGVTSEPIAQILLDAVKMLQQDKKKAVRILLKEEDKNEDPQSDSDKEGEIILPETEFAGPTASVDITQPRQLKFWTQQPTFAVTCVKFYYRKHVDIRNYPKTLTYEQLLAHVGELYPATLKKKKGVVLRVKTNDGELTAISDDEELQGIKALYAGRTLNVYLKK